MLYTVYGKLVLFSWNVCSVEKFSLISSLLIYISVSDCVTEEHFGFCNKKKTNVNSKWLLVSTPTENKSLKDVALRTGHVHESTPQIMTEAFMGCISCIIYGKTTLLRSWDFREACHSVMLNCVWFFMIQHTSISTERQTWGVNTETAIHFHIQTYGQFRVVNNK